MCQLKMRIYQQILVVGLHFEVTKSDMSFFCLFFAESHQIQ